MNGTNVILRVNSYQTRNTVLFETGALRGSNKTENCQRRPILECAKDFFKAVQDEVNNQINLTVHGNAFDVVFLRGISAGYPVNAVSRKEHSVFWSTRQRLHLLQDMLGDVWEALSVPVVMTGDASLTLPDYPMVSFGGATSPRKLVIAKTRYEITDAFEDYICEPVAFLVDGSTRLEESAGKYILHCSVDNVLELVCGYLETKYINPFIGSLVAKYGDRFSITSAPGAFLIDRIEPYYYLEPGREKVRLFRGDKATLGIHSVSLSANGEVSPDSPTDIARLTYSLDERLDDISLTDRGLIINPDDLRGIYAVHAGSYRIGYFFEDNTELFSVAITAVEHQYVNNISFDLLDGDSAIERWRIGKRYRIKFSFFPQGAEDAEEITFASSNPSVARVEGNEVLILNEGVFQLVAATKRVSFKRTFSVENAIVKAISVSGWPTAMVEYGASFHVKVSVAPAAANYSGFQYEVTSGNGNVVVERDGRAGLNITAAKAGECTIKFSSVDNPDVACFQTISISPEPYKKMFLVIVGFIILFLGASPGDLLSAVIATAFAALVCYFGVRRRERFAKIALVILLLIGLEHILGLIGEEISKDNAQPATTQMSISQLEKEAKSLVSESTYTDHTGNSWTLTDTEYLGYMVCASNSDYYAFFIHEVTVSSPKESAPREMFSVVSYEGNFNKYASFRANGTSSGEVVWSESFSDWMDDYAYNDDVREMSFSDEELHNLIGWDKYLSSVNWDGLVSQFMDAEKKKHEEDGYFTYSEIELDGIYFAQKKGGSQSSNKLYILISYDRYMPDGALNFHMCAALGFADIVVDSEGNILLAYEDGKRESEYHTAEEFIKNLEEKYLVTKVE